MDAACYCVRDESDYLTEDDANGILKEIRSYHGHRFRKGRVEQDQHHRWVVHFDYYNTVAKGWSAYSVINLAQWRGYQKHLT